MTKDELKPVMFAWLNEQPIQACLDLHISTDSPWKDVESETPDFFNPTLRWRIKPTSTLRPWKSEEVPVGALIRKSEYNNRPSMILCINNYQVSISWFSPVTRELTFSNLLDGWEHSLDHGKTWLPCGVLE